MHLVEQLDLSCTVGFDVGSRVELAELGRGAQIIGLFSHLYAWSVGLALSQFCFTSYDTVNGILWNPNLQAILSIFWINKIQG